MSKKSIHFKVIQKSRIDALEEQALTDKGRSITGGGCTALSKCPTLTNLCPTDLPCADLICADLICADLIICGDFICIDRINPCPTFCKGVMCGDDPRPDPF